MAVIAGFFPESTLNHGALHTSADLDAYSEMWVGSLDAMSIDVAALELLTTHWPVSAAPAARSGSIAGSWFSDFYHRVHVVPQRVDIGNLLTVQSRDVEVWNAHLAPQALSSIGSIGTDGMATSGVSAPTTFAPLEERIFTVVVSDKGPATIDALYTFAFATESPTLAVTGRRVVVFAHAPNWGDKLLESYAWLTDVIESYDGTEQRIALLGVPRRGLEFSVDTLSQHESNRLETLLLGWQAQLFAVPVWTDMQRLTAVLPSGSTAIPCATAGYEFAAADLVLLWRAHDSHEPLEINSVGAGSLALSNPTVSDWPAGTLLMPLRLGRLPASQKLDRPTGHHFSTRVAFSFDDHPGWPPADVGTLYLGFPVYPLRPNWAGGIDVEHMRKLAALDYDTGVRWANDESGMAALMKRWNWMHRGRDQIVAFRSWLAARRGRQVPFWSETQGSDMTVTAPIGASDVSFHIRNIGYARYLNARADRRHLAIRTRAGDAYYRRIVGASEDSEAVETVQIDSAIGALLDPADIEAIRFLHLTRLESDSVDIEWHHLTLAETTAGLRSLPQ